MDATDKPREILIHQSVNRPNLILGGDRELVLVMVMITGGLAFSLASWWGIGLAASLWVGSMWALPIIPVPLKAPDPDVTLKTTKTHRPARSKPRHGHARLAGI